jgi:RNA polymerase sigma-70 factor (ECF subfamily)
MSAMPPQAEDVVIARAELTACLARVAAGDRAALADLYRRTSVKLFTLCLRMLRERSEAEDVVQEIYITVWNKAATFDAARGVSPMTWLLVVARNKALDRLRVRARTTEGLDAADEIPDAGPLADVMLERGQLSQRLADCLAGLDERAARAIRAAFFGGQTYETLARAAAMPLGSMKSIVRRGLIRLKTCVET